MGLSVFIIYIIVMIMVCLAQKQKHTNKETFFINGRTSSSSMVASSIVASCVGASATIGVVGLAFQVGTPAFWWLGSGAVGLSILTVFLTKKVRRSQAYTLPELVNNLLGDRISHLISVIIVIAWTAIVAAQLTACSMIVSALTGFAPISALMISAVLIALHTLSGGQASIIKLDRIQCFIIIAGLLITALWLGHYNAPVIYEIKFELVNQQFPVERLVYFLLVLGGSYIVCPMLYGRVLSAKNEHVAQKGVLAAAIVMVLVSILIVLIGLLARGLIPADTPTDSVLTTVLGSVFPHWLTVLIYLVLLSAVVSSADSCLLTAGIVLSQDILRKDSITATRWHTAILMAIAFLLTFTNKSILDFLLMANDVYVAGVVAPVFICLLYAHTTKKANPHLALLGVFLGGSLGLISALSASNTFFYTGIASSIIFTLLSFQIKTTQPKGQ